ncbi:MAG: hypothetical protein AB7L70_06015 [Pyrinomonadaceae bacterium]
MILPALLSPDDSPSLLFWFVFGAFFGLVIQALSDLRARQRSKGNNDPNIYKVRQERCVTVLLEPTKAFDLCQDAVNSLDRMKLKRVDRAANEIIARSRSTWDIFGSVVTLKLEAIGENLTNVRIETRPIPRTAAVDYGESWETVEKIVEYLRKKDARIQDRLLEEGAKIIEIAARRPVEKIIERKSPINGN